MKDPTPTIQFNATTTSNKRARAERGGPETGDRGEGKDRRSDSEQGGRKDERAGKADLSQESVKTSERLRWLDGVRWREQDLSRTQCKSDSYVFNFKNVLLF